MRAGSAAHIFPFNFSESITSSTLHVTFSITSTHHSFFGLRPISDSPLLLLFRPHFQPIASSLLLFFLSTRTSKPFQYVFRLTFPVTFGAGKLFLLRSYPILSDLVTPYPVDLSVLVFATFVFISSFRN